jgi:hypothetical protein
VERPGVVQSPGLQLGEIFNTEGEHRNCILIFIGSYNMG